MIEKEILKKRAERLSKPLEERQQFYGLEVLGFTLGDESYALETRYIEEVYPLKECTPLPKAPPFVFGLTHIRRKIMLVINLKILFDIPNLKEVKDPKLIILGQEDREFALLTDGLNGIQTISNEQIQSSLPTLKGIREDFLKGVSSDGTVILDGRKLLASKVLILDEAVV